MCLYVADALWRAGSAQATRRLPNRHGDFYEAFEFDVPLRLVTLSGSMPGDWEQEFKALMQGRSKLQIDRRGQLLEIYEELKNPGYGIPQCHEFYTLCISSDTADQVHVYSFIHYIATA